MCDIWFHLKRVGDCFGFGIPPYCRPPTLKGLSKSAIPCVWLLHAVAALFSRLDECTGLFPCVRQTRAANAPAFQDPAVLDFCGCRMRLPQGNSLVTSLSLLLQQSSRKTRNKYYNVGKDLSSSTCLPHAFAVHMERQLDAVAGCGAANVCDNRTHGIAA